MKLNNSRAITIWVILIVGFCETISAQGIRERMTGNGCGKASVLNGVYRIDLESSDKLYSVIEGASTNVPFADQQQFFIDLAVRLTPPDLLAIECLGNRISLGSSRAPRTEFVADGLTRSIRSRDGRIVRSRIGFERDSLTFTSGGKGDDNLSFTFTPIENGRRLRVTRRISAQELIEPVVIRTIYQKISDVASWEVFSENVQVAGQADKPDPAKTPPAVAAAGRERNVVSENKEATSLREALDQWIAATNARDIEKQMSYYMPQLRAFYLARNASRNAVRLEKTRAFAAAKSIDIRAEEPEIIFQEAGQVAVMRFRKKYDIRGASKSRSGEVVQELRWRQTANGWRIFSERDIRVLR